MNAVITTEGTLRNPRGAAIAGRPAAGEIPRINPWLLRSFSYYAQRHLRNHFHAMRVTGALPHDSFDRAVVVYMNHASWWDPLVGLELKNRFFPKRRAYAPIEAGMLERYRFFRRLGFFGVEQGSARAAFSFLQTAEALLANDETLLMITPQARFADARERPLRFANGIGHLAVRCPHAVFLPIAVEYVFWQERFPEILIRFGDAIQMEEFSGRTTEARKLELEDALSATQDALAGQAQSRNPSEFQTILRGKAGAAPAYDRWRSLRAFVTGKTFQPEHGQHA